MAGKKETQAEWPSSEAGQKHHRDETEREGPVKSTWPRTNLNLSEVMGDRPELGCPGPLSSPQTRGYMAGVTTCCKEEQVLP